MTPAAGTDVDLSDEQMKSRLGDKPGARVEMILLDGVLYRREQGGWSAYPPTSLR